MTHGTIDALLERLSGGFQLLLLLVLATNLALVALNQAILDHFLTTPDHHCKLPEGWKEDDWLPATAMASLRRPSTPRHPFSIDAPLARATPVGVNKLAGPTNSSSEQESVRGIRLGRGGNKGEVNRKANNSVKSIEWEPLELEAEGLLDSSVEQILSQPGHKMVRRSASDCCDKLTSSGSYPLGDGTTSIVSSDLPHPSDGSLFKNLEIKSEGGVTQSRSLEEGEYMREKLIAIILAPTIDEGFEEDLRNIKINHSDFGNMASMGIVDVSDGGDDVTYDRSDPGLRKSSHIQVKHYKIGGHLNMGPQLLAEYTLKDRRNDDMPFEESTTNHYGTDSPLNSSGFTKSANVSLADRPDHIAENENEDPDRRTISSEIVNFPDSVYHSEIDHSTLTSNLTEGPSTRLFEVTNSFTNELNIMNRSSVVGSSTKDFITMTEILPEVDEEFNVINGRTGLKKNALRENSDQADLFDFDDNQNGFQVSTEEWTVPSSPLAKIKSTQKLQENVTEPDNDNNYHVFKMDLENGASILRHVDSTKKLAVTESIGSFKNSLATNDMTNVTDSPLLTMFTETSAETNANNNNNKFPNDVQGDIGIEINRTQFQIVTKKTHTEENGLPNDSKHGAHFDANLTIESLAPLASEPDEKEEAEIQSEGHTEVSSAASLSFASAEPRQDSSSTNFRNYDSSANSGVTVGQVKYSSCEMFVDSLDPFKGTKSCVYGYLFNLHGKEWSISAEWGLVCQRAWLRHWLRTIVHLGGVLGGLLGGLLADRFGRRLLLVLSVAAVGVLGAFLHLVRRLLLFTALRCCQAFFLQSVWVLSWVLACELLPPGWRTGGLVGVAGVAPLGVGAAVGAALYLQHWRSVELAISIPTLASLLYVWIIPESLRWLLGRGKTGRALVESGRTAKQNLQALPPTAGAHLTQLAGVSGVAGVGHSRGNLPSLLRGPRLRRSTFILLWIWFAVSVCDHMLWSAIMSAPTSTMGWLSFPLVDWAHIDPLSGMTSSVWVIRTSTVIAVRLGAALALGGLVALLSRRTVLMVHLFAASGLTVALVASQLLWSGADKTLASLHSGLHLAGVATLFGARSMMIIISLESLPTQARASGIGLFSAVATVGELLPPLLYMLDSVTFPSLPWILVSSFTLVSAVIVCLLPDTSKTALPDVPEEAEVLSKGIKTCFPDTQSHENLNFIRKSVNSGGRYRSSTSVIQKATNVRINPLTTSRRITQPQDLSRSFRYSRYAQDAASTCSQCSVVSLVDVSKVNGNNSDTTDSKSFRRYPVERLRKSFKRKTLHTAARESRSLLGSRLKTFSDLAPSFVSNSRLVESDYFSLNRRFEFRPQWIAPDCPSTEFYSLNPNYNTEDDDYSSITLCSLEMRNTRRHRSPTELRRQARRNPMCEKCEESKNRAEETRDYHIKCISGQIETNPLRRNKRSLTSLSFSGYTTRSKLLSEIIQGKKLQVRKENPKLSDLRQSDRGNGSSSTAVQGTHFPPIVPPTIKVDSKIDVLTYQVPNKKEKKEAGKPRPRVSQDILMRLQELKKSAKLTGECGLFD